MQDRWKKIRKMQDHDSNLNRENKNINRSIDKFIESSSGLSAKVEPDGLSK